MLRYFWKNKIALLLLLFAIWLVPVTIGLSEQSQTESIVTAMGIDKQEGEYEVSLQYIIPNPSGSPEGLKMISQKGETVGEAIEKIKLQLGKLSGFAHCRFLAFNDEASNENFTQMLDYLTRRKTNTNNIVLINTPTSSKDLLSISSNLDSDLYSLLNNNGFSSELLDFHEFKTVGDYYESYFSPVKCLVINTIETSSSNNSESESGEGGGEGQKSSGGSSGASNSSTQSKELKNEGKYVIIKNEKRLINLTQEESQNLSWFNSEIKRDIFIVRNFSENNIKNANLLFNVTNKIFKAKPRFENGIPNFDITLKLYVRTGEVAADNLKTSDFEVLQRKYSDKLVSEMKKVIMESLKKAENHFKENNYDVINCYLSFYKTKNAEFKEYLKNINEEEFIKNVIFNYDVQIIQGY